MLTKAHQYVMPEYCARGCGRLASMCVSGGSKETTCSDIPEPHQDYQLDAPTDMEVDKSNEMDGQWNVKDR